MTAGIWLWIIPAVFAVSFAGLAYVVGRAMRSGIEAYAGEYTAETAQQFEDIFLFIPPRRILELAWVTAAVVFLLLFFLVGSFSSTAGVAKGALAGGLTGALALRAPTLLLRVLRTRRLQRFNVQLVDALMTMSNALKAGFSITQAFQAVVKEEVNPIAQEFTVFLQQMRVGVRFEEALRNLETRVGSDDLKLMVVAIETARQTGGNLIEVFENIARTIRERMRVQLRIRTLTAQGRLQGIIVGLVPVLLAGALVLIDPAMMLGFLRSAMGITIVVIVLVLEFLGAFFIRKIIRIDI